MSKFSGTLRVNPANPRYFTDDTGKSILLCGSHTWAVMQDMGILEEGLQPMDYDGFLHMLADNGHNFIRFWQWQYVRDIPWSKKPFIFWPSPWARTGPGLAADGLPKFNLEIFNEDYFKRLRERVDKASDQGIYLSIMLFEAWGIKWAKPGADPWLYHPFHPANNVNALPDLPLTDGRAHEFYTLHHPEYLKYQEAYVRKEIDTLNPLENILYEICNEVPTCLPAYDWEYHMVRFIKEYETSKIKQHPVGITAEGDLQDNEILLNSPADWVSLGAGKGREYKFNPPDLLGRKVSLLDTDHLWGHGGSYIWAWKAFTRGHNVLFMDPWEPIIGSQEWWQDGDITRNQRYYYAWDPLRRNLGYILHYAQKINLNRVLPHPELSTTTYCLAEPGQAYLCFNPEGGWFGLNLWDAAGVYSCEWFNPYTGVTYTGNSITGDRPCEVKAPFDGPGVLYLVKKDQ